jgi:hypothetical protein
MRNMIRTALIVGTLATPMIAMADTPAKKDAAPAKDAKATDAKDTTKPDAKADAKTDAKTDAKKAPAKKGDAKAKDPATK